MQEAQVNINTRKMEQRTRIHYKTTTRNQKEVLEQEKVHIANLASLETKSRLRNDKDMRKNVVRHEKNRRLHAREILQNRNVYATEISAQNVQQGRVHMSNNQCE